MDPFSSEDAVASKLAVVPTSDFAPDVRSAIDEALASDACLWVTDADKTLWAGDIGEAFLLSLAQQRVLVAPDAREDAWATYQRKVAEDQTGGYAWAVQAMAGLKEADVRRYAREFAEPFVAREAFTAFRTLVKEANALGRETWVVSASSQWIVEAGAELMGLDPKRVIGIRVAVEEGVLTDRAIDPVSNRAGKVAAIRNHVRRQPTLATGDSSGDFEMLADADTAVLVTQPGRTDPAYVVQARRRGWLVQSFPTPDVRPPGA